MLPPPCPPAQELRAWEAAAVAAPEARQTPATTPAPEESPAAASLAQAEDYRHRLSPTPAGWPTLARWCVWIEPAVQTGPAALWEQRWWRAVHAALTTWRAELPITLVDDPAAAQVRVWRRRPPIQNRRASHGRSQLQLLAVRRDQGWRLEPRVEVLISPGQGEAPLQATALHELGHAFGLWGHSDQPDDVLAVHPGPRPVLALTSRDRATLRWLRSQPGLRQELLPPGLTRPGTATP